MGDTGLVTVQGEGWICPQCAGGSQEPLGVSVGLMLMLVTSSKNEQKKGRRGKMTWSIGGPVRGWQHLLSPRGHSGIQRSAGGRIPRELLPIPVPSLSYPCPTLWHQPRWRLTRGQPGDTSLESLGMPW